MRRLAKAVLAVAAAAVAGTTVPPPAAASTSTQVRDATPVAVQYRPPVAAPIVDSFRPPATPYGPGNVGIDYTTAPGTPVAAAAAGQVVFAGRVGAELHVVVLHADGIRTSSSFLASVAVRRGQQVAAGQTLGTTGLSLHFGARAGDAYLDPLVLFGAGTGPVVVRLVPDLRVMGSEADERSSLRRFLGAVTSGVAGVSGTAVGWARDGVVAVGTGVVAVGDGVVALGAGALDTAEELQAWVDAVVPFSPASFVRLASGMEEWWSRRHTCTPSGVRPPRPPGRRRVVLVAGLGSTSDRGAGVDGVDTTALGYAPGDVQRFSYKGGTTAESAYSAADTQVDIAASARRLRDLLERLVAAEPGVPVDVIAHSQGGLVSRVALGPRPPPGVEHLITLATPHQGADLATVLDLAATTPKGALVEEGVSRLGVSGIDPTSTSVRQLSETSAFLRELNAQPLPEGVRVTSIAGRADVVVPAPRAHLRGATNAVVTVDGLHEHPLVPGAPAATREMTLALAGMAPTCEGFLDAVADAVVGETIAAAEDTLGVALWGLAS
ncbi:MAG: peptidoglycan DD-metalloendopeptidase family protein [Acidimicrobiales bacterium]